ncbi:MAG: MoaD/ThiS family protein [Actinomycetales bacterium]|nr:MoaD/ThiS family protein [Tetrasphaera sp.]NLW99790.1 MoaD/ThiS family protein [Actinomycetales bacterium]
MRPNDGGILVRYWAGARAAAGVAEEYVPLTEGARVADVIAEVRQSRPALDPVLDVASLLLDGRAARAEEPVGAATTLEVLPPFAGG